VKIHSLSMRSVPATPSSVYIGEDMRGAPAGGLRRDRRSILSHGTAAALKHI
jgi:hypothetical protein